MKAVRWCGLALALASASARAAEAPKALETRYADLPELAPAETRVGVLPSGLRFVVEARHDHPTVGVAMVFPSGAGADPVGHAGAAHLAEHAWFRQRTPSGQTVREQLVALHAEYQGLTGLDDTTFAAVAPREALPALLALEALRLESGVSAITDEELASERLIVARELVLRGVEHSAALWSAVAAHLFPEGHPYHNRGTAPDGELTAVSRAEVAAAAGRWNVGGATLLLTGDLPEGLELDSLLKEQLPAAECSPGTPLGPWPDAPAAPPLPHPVQAGLDDVLADVSEPRLAFAWALPGRAAAESVPLALSVEVARILLEVSVADGSVEGRDRASGVECSLDTRALASTLVCTVPMGPSGWPDTLAARALSTFDEVLFAGIGEAVETLRDRAVARAQVDLLARSEGLASGSLDALLHLSRAFEAGGPEAGASAVTARLGGVGLGEILALARRYFVRDHAVTLLLLPNPRAPADGTIADAPAVAGSGKASLSPAVAPRDLPDPSAWLRERLPNGLEVVVVHSATFPVVRATLDVRTGASRASEPLLDSRLWASVGAFRGSEGRELSVLPMRVVGSWDFQEGSDGHRFGVTGPASRAPDLLADLGRLVTTLASHPAEDPGWWSSHPARHLDPWTLARNDVRAAIFGAHTLSRGDVPRGGTLFGPESDGAVRRAFASTYTADNSALFIVGPVDGEATLAAARAAFAGWTTLPHHEAPLPLPPAPPSRRSIRVYEASSAWTTVGVSCLVEAATADNAAPREVLGELLDGLLWERLREATAWSYAPRGRVWEAAGGLAGLTLSAPGKAGASGLVVQEMLAVLGGVAAGDIAPERLVRVRDAVAARSALRLMTAAGLLEALLRTWELERPAEEAIGTSRMLTSVTPEAISALLAPCVGREVVTVVGPPGEYSSVIGLFPQAVDVDAAEQAR